MDARRTVSGLRMRRVGVAAHAQWRPDAAEHAPKLLPERGVAERIEERVERRVEVSNPRSDNHLDSTWVKCAMDNHGQCSSALPRP